MAHHRPADPGVKLAAAGSLALAAAAFVVCAGTMLIAFASALAQAQLSKPALPYPSKPVRIIVAYPPGGGTDVLTRLVAKYLDGSLKAAIVIENRAGANAQIGMEAVSKAAPDGYTLLAIAAGPLNDKNLGLFIPVALFAAPSYVLVVHPAVQARSVSELIELAKAHPGALSYGSTGGGSASHLAAELFKSMAQVDILDVPYKGVGNAVSDLLGGQVQVMIAPIQAVMPNIKAGMLRALGVTGTERSQVLPELPTVDEAGVPGYSAQGWFGLVAPAGTPNDVVAFLNGEVRSVLQRPEVKARLLELGAQPADLDPAAFLEFIRRDNAKWAKLIKERGIVVEGQS